MVGKELICLRRQSWLSHNSDLFVKGSQAAGLYTLPLLEPTAGQG